MSHSIDTCRLFMHWRNRAYRTRDLDSAPILTGFVDPDPELREPNQLGLSATDATQAMHRLLEAEVVHWAADLPVQDGTLPTEHHRALFVEPLDDLTAATLLMGNA